MGGGAKIRSFATRTAKNTAKRYQRIRNMSSTIDIPEDSGSAGVSAAEFSRGITSSAPSTTSDGQIYCFTASTVANCDIDCNFVDIVLTVVS